MPGIAGFKKGFKKLFNFVKKPDEKRKKHFTHDEAKSENKQIENDKKGLEHGHSIEDYAKDMKSIIRSESSSEVLKQGQTETFTEGDDNQRNQSNNAETETNDLTVIEDSVNKPIAIVRPCQKVEVEEQQSTTDNDLFKINDLNCDVSNENKIMTPQEVIKRNECETEDEKKIDESKVVVENIYKTKEDILKIENELKRFNDESILISEEIENVEHSNLQMRIIVEEFERTIQQLVAEKEKEEVCQHIRMERILGEKEDIVSDHQNVERAFADLTAKYERARNIVPALKVCEDNLKESVAELSSRYSAEVVKYEESRAEAENNLAMAEQTLIDRKKAKALEVARLTAQLRKAEMNISSLEKEIDQKGQDNQELATMCDHLIDRLENTDLYS